MVRRTPYGLLSVLVLLPVGCGSEAGVVSHRTDALDAVFVVPEVVAPAPDLGAGVDADDGLEDVVIVADAEVPEDVWEELDTAADVAEAADVVESEDLAAEVAEDVGLDEVADAVKDVPAPVCSMVAAPAPVADAPLDPVDPTGTVQTTTAAGFTDDTLLGPAAGIRVATRREWGSAIVFFGQVGGATNVIDGNDTGREVQVAVYDPARAMQGCAWNASCQVAPSSCPVSITYLGWNPVQGGNECNVGSGTEAVLNAPGLLAADVRPLQWNPDWSEPTCINDGCTKPTEPGDVRLHQRLRFVHTHIVELSLDVENLTDLDHAPTAQEFPTMYAAYGASGLGNYGTLLDGDGAAVTIDQPANDGFFVKDFTSPSGWVSLQNAKLDYGVGLYNESRLSGWQGWQKAGVFNNVRAKLAFGLGPKAHVRARAYLLLGSFETQKGLAAWLVQHLAPFGTLDTPAAEATVGTTFDVAGWVLDDGAVVALELRVDGQKAADLALAVPRPDVCAAWPGYAMCVGAVGFATTVTVTPCDHLLEVVATDDLGNTRVVGSGRVHVE